jgi:hypothetical protein
VTGERKWMREERERKNGGNMTRVRNEKCERKKGEREKEVEQKRGGKESYENRKRKRK